MTPEEKLAKLKKLKELKAMRDGSQDKPAVQGITATIPPIPQQKTMNPFMRIPEGTYDGLLDAPEARMREARQLASSGNIPAGIAKTITGAAQFAGVPFVAADRTLRTSPAGTAIANTAQAILSPIGMMAKALGGLTESGVGLVASPETAQATGETVENVAPIFTPSLIKGARQVVSAPIRAIGKKLPAEHLYQDAGNLGSYTKPSLTKLDNTIKRGLDEQIPFGGSFRAQRANLNKVETTLTDIATKEITPEIQRLTQSGVKVPTKDIVIEARLFLKSKNADLTGAQKVKFENALRKLEEDFKAGEGATITPDRMQNMKTAIHDKVVYDEAGAFAKEWEKAIGHQMRVKLEQLSPKLGEYNKRYGEIAPIRDSIFDEIFRSGDATPAGLGSAPFYMAVAEPLRGAALSGSRAVIKSPRNLSRGAIGIAKMRKAGKKPSILPSFMPPTRDEE